MAWKNAVKSIVRSRLAVFALILNFLVISSSALTALGAPVPPGVLVPAGNGFGVAMYGQMPVGAVSTRGLAFDGAATLYETTSSGQLYKQTRNLADLNTGGPATLVGTLANNPDGLAFSRDKSRLFVARSGAYSVTINGGSHNVTSDGLGDVVEINPATGAVLRTMATGAAAAAIAGGLNQVCPSGLATDPLDGSLWFTDGCSDQNLAWYYHIANVESGTPALVAPVATTMPMTVATGRPAYDLTITPGGTFLVTDLVGNVLSAQRGQRADVLLMPPGGATRGVAFVGIDSTQGTDKPIYLYTTGTDGFMLKANTRVAGAYRTVATSAGTGYHMVIGPDNCLYSAQTVPSGPAVFRVSKSDGTCDLFNAGENTFLATLTGPTSPLFVNTDTATLTVAVSGIPSGVQSNQVSVALSTSAGSVNPRTGVAGTQTNFIAGVAPNLGSATYTYSYIGANVGADTFTATATIAGGGGTATTNQATVNWKAPVTPTKVLTLAKAATPTTYSAVGQVITYSFTVTNSGTGTFTGPFTVSDTKLDAAAICAAGPLASLASLTCTGTHTVTQADLDAGSIVNTATATGDTITSPSATATVTATKSPALTLRKSATPTTYSAVGQVITYAFTITNAGNVTQSGPFTVSDLKLSGTPIACGVATSLAPGAATSCTQSYSITQADLTAGSVTNSATATGPAGPPSPPSSVTITGGGTKVLTLAKAATPTTYSAVGQVITYSFTVTNSGTATLSGPFTVSDLKIPAASCPASATALAPAASLVCSGTYTVTQADLDAGSIVNAATVSGAGVMSNSSTATVTASVTKALTLVKSASPTTYSAAGQVITYTFTITNGGTATLSGPFTVSDLKLSSTPIACSTVASLAPGGQTSCTQTYSITQSDLDARSVTNSATATDPAGPPSPAATATVAATGIRKAFTLVKSAAPTTYSAVGQVITYTFTITNTGNVTLGSAISVTDATLNPATPTFTCLPGPFALAVGTQMTCTQTHAITQADLDAGSIVNTATATDGVVTAGPSSATVTATGTTKALTLTKSASPTTFAAVGDVITYTFTIKNTGNVTQAGAFTVSDPKLSATPIACSTAASLAPAATTSCTQTYSITQADVTAGSAANTATATGPSGPPSPPASVTVTRASGRIPTTTTVTSGQYLPAATTGAGERDDSGDKFCSYSEMAAKYAAKGPKYAAKAARYAARALTAGSGPCNDDDEGDDHSDSAKSCELADKASRYAAEGSEYGEKAARYLAMSAEFGGCQIAGDEPGTSATGSGAASNDTSKGDRSGDDRTQQQRDRETERSSRDSDGGDGRSCYYAEKASREAAQGPEHAEDAAHDLARAGAAGGCSAGTEPTPASGVAFTAHLIENPGQTALAGKTITISAGGRTGSGLTNTHGDVTVTLALAVGAYTDVRASFAGDLVYLPSVGDNQPNVIVYQDTGAGSFVIWGANRATIGQSVPIGSERQFWGAQWARQITAGPYFAHNDFKGWSASTFTSPNPGYASPTGAYYSTKPGQSTEPPETIGAYIRVIITTRTSKDGSGDRGNIAAWAILRVDNPARYDADPGHAGLGTVVAIIN